MMKWKWFEASSSPRAQNHGEERHADIESILCLSEVGGPLVRVELGRDLELPGQGMEHPHARLGPVHRLVVDDVVLAGLAVEALRLEPLFLNPANTKNLNDATDQTTELATYTSDL